MKKAVFLPLLRELAHCYQTFESFSAAHIRSLGLTPAQFDLVVTLGNTEGMSFKDLGEKTLITKGTLTGVVDRLVTKGLARRVASPTDGRSQTVQLTEQGAALFARIFPAHLAHLRPAFAEFRDAELRQAQATLLRLRQALERARRRPDGPA
ncbi:HTH-type transcriptional regulator MhqR [mine drainage metagenome]|uniref:HTH-type transcriptional regulator MhqR n=1 Tax=mine drainage metagenome TaxID=410659 RepID=A0A1J5RF73_9ZZZZ